MYLFPVTYPFFASCGWLSPTHITSRSEHNILFDFSRSRRALAHLIRMSGIFRIRLAALMTKPEGSKRCRISPGGDDYERQSKPGDNPLLLKRLYILRTDSLGRCRGW